MATEECCSRRQLPGRLIPLPSRISSECGLCWSAPPEARSELLAALNEERIATGATYELEI